MSARALHPVAWLEGMFLRPQHLQQHDRHWDARLAQLARSLDPFHWGVRELELNPEALGDHRIEVTRLAAVLPGGTWLEYPGGCALELREFDPSAERVDVWVGLRHPRAGEPQSAPQEGAARDARYRIRSAEVADLNRGEADAPVEFLVPNARLLLSGEERELEQHDALRLCSVVATGELRRPFALARECAPALLAVQAWSPLAELLERALGQFAARLRVVAGRASTVAIADLPRMWLRHSLARSLPLLRHMLGSGATPPYALYGALAELAGALAAFAQGHELELARYDHADPYPRFAELVQLLERQLEQVVPQRFHELQLKLERGAYATSELGAELAHPRNAFFVGIRAELDSAELAALVRESAKCAALGELGSLPLFNLAGLRLEPLPGAPSEIAARVGYVYWKLEPHGRLWNRVRSEGSLALGTLEAAEVRLYVVTPEAAP